MRRAPAVSRCRGGRGGPRPRGARSVGGGIGRGVDSSAPRAVPARRAGGGGRALGGGRGCLGERPSLRRERDVRTPVEQTAHDLDVAVLRRREQRRDPPRVHTVHRVHRRVAAQQRLDVRRTPFICSLVQGRVAARVDGVDELGRRRDEQLDRRGRLVVPSRQVERDRAAAPAPGWARTGRVRSDDGRRREEAEEGVSARARRRAMDASSRMTSSVAAAGAGGGGGAREAPAHSHRASRAWRPARRGAHRFTKLASALFSSKAATMCGFPA